MKRFAALAIVGSGILLSALLVAAPAEASTSQGYVAGAGVVTDDFGDEGTISVGQHAYSGATGLWQWILVADGAKKPNGKAFTSNDVDFDFGPTTQAATKNWQSSHGLNPDGIVGPATLAEAQKSLVNVNHCEGAGPYNTETCDTIMYFGRVDDAYFARAASNGEYWVDGVNCGPDYDEVAATYGTPNFSHDVCTD